MKIFITGSTGFIGQHLAHRLVKDGHEIICLVRSRQKQSLLPSQHTTIIEGDLNIFKNAKFELPECDVVIHLAGQVTANRCEDYKKSNFDPVVDLVQLIKRSSSQPKELLFSSSLAASGPGSLEAPLNESTPEKPIDAYGQAKYDAELYLQQHCPIPTTSFRPCAVMGPADPNFLNMFKIAKKGFGFVPAGRNQPLSLVHVDDVVEAIIKILATPSQNHRTYFVSHPKSLTTHELWIEVGKSLGKSLNLIPLPKALMYVGMKADTTWSKLTGGQAVFDRKYYNQLQADSWVCSSEKLSKETGWIPKKDPITTISETSSDYKKRKWL